MNNLFVLFVGDDGLAGEFGQVVATVGRLALLEMRDPLDGRPEPELVRRPRAVLLSGRCRLFRDEAAAKRHWEADRRDQPIMELLRRREQRQVA